MAIEIIGVDQGLFKQTTCNKCASILRYVLADVQSRRVSCMGDVDTVTYISCPKCGKEIPVKDY